MIEVDPELLAFLQSEEARGRNEDLLERADTALKSYNREPYGDEIEGRSQVVTGDVMEVVDHMNVSVLRTFVSGDRVVEFEPDGEETEQFADDATESISRDFQRKGYQLLHDWLKEGNISTLGIVKASVEIKRERIERVAPTMLLDYVPDDMEIVGADEPYMEDGVEVAKIAALVKGKAEFKDYLVPLEEFRISPDARDLDDAAYIAHASIKTLSELREMGFDDVDDLQGDISPDQLMHSRGNEDFFNGDRQGPMRKVVLLEEYARFDLNGDGIAERLCVHRVGNTVLRIEEVDYQPFVHYCPFPMPGRLAGQSLADKVTDIQRVNTALNRLALDGLYMNLAPRHWVPNESVTEDTYDDLLTVIPGGIVRGKGLAPTPLQHHDVSQTAWNAIEFMIGQRESRTGITRLNQGLDADAMNKTATGTALMQAQGQQMEEYLARNFGEALSRLMRLKLKLKSRYGSPEKLRVDGEYREIDPSEWPEDMNVMIRVGLGSGKKEQRLQSRMLLLQIQRECMAAGLPIVRPTHIHKSISGVVKDANLGSPNDFVDDPDSEEVQARMAQQGEQPDPEQQKLEAEMQMQSAKLQGEQQLAGAKMQGEQAIQQMKIEAMREEAQTKAELAQAQAVADAQLARDKAEFEASIAREKFAFEQQLAMEKLAFEERRSERDAARRDFETDSKVSANRSGGKLDE